MAYGGLNSIWEDLRLWGYVSMWNGVVEESENPQWAQELRDVEKLLQDHNVYDDVWSYCCKLIILSVWFWG